MSALLLLLQKGRKEFSLTSNYTECQMIVCFLTICICLRQVVFSALCLKKVHSKSGASVGFFHFKSLFPHEVNVARHDMFKVHCIFLLRVLLRHC